jgi:hypothetical protein
MADGMLRTMNASLGGDIDVEVDDSDVDNLETGTLRVLRVRAAKKLGTAPGLYRELELNGESLVIVDVAVDNKRGNTALVTVR